MTECLIGLLCVLNVAFVVVGALIWRRLQRRVTGLESRLVLLEQATPLAATVSAPLANAAAAVDLVSMGPAAPSAPEVLRPLGPPEAGASMAVLEASPEPEGAQAAVVAALDAPTDALLAPVMPTKTPTNLPRQQHPLVEWFVNMHLMVQIGLIVLFFGVGFLVKYAADQGWFPLEVRLISAALLGLGLAVVGWRLRQRRRTYGLALIGGGIGIVYVTAFGAYSFYQLLSAPLAFTTFVMLSLLYAALAILCDAPILAFLAIVGAFLAPLLASENQGNHLVLFSYYAVVNLGVLAIARFKQWSRLNLASFCFSAVAAAGWATTGYQSIYFGSTALFLALFFSFYLAISLWQALRRTEDDTDRKIDIGDVIILFANPLVSFLLFVGLFQEQRTWIAYGAVGLALLYGGLSYLLQRRQSARARFTSDSMFFFAAFFITLAIPLRFDAKLTAAIWSVMGVGLVWASIHRGQLLLRGWGLLVHLLAMGAFLVNWSQIPELRPALPPLTNHLYIGALIISVTLLMSGALLHRQRTHSTGSSAPLVWILLGVGLFWWYAGGISQFLMVEYWADPLPAFLLFLTISGWLAEVVGRWLAWRALRWPVFTVLPSAAIVALTLLNSRPHPLAVAWYIWPAVLVVHLLLLQGHRKGYLIALYHAGGLWLAAFILSWRIIVWALAVAVASGWQAVLYTAVALGILAVLGLFGEHLPWPVSTAPRAYRSLATAPLLLWVLLVAARFAISSAGDSTPLPFVPLLNPLDLTLAVVVGLMINWLRVQRRLWPTLARQPLWSLAPWLVAALTFVFINTAAARALHQLTAVPYQWDQLFASTALQMTFALLWALLALTFMFTAHYRRLHQIWYIGATILGLTIVKLFLIDLAQSGTLARIISFIGVGLLTITVAYFWPAPPRQPAFVEAESSRWTWL